MPAPFSLYHPIGPYIKLPFLESRAGLSTASAALRERSDLRRVRRGAGRYGVQRVGEEQRIAGSDEDFSQ